MCIAANEIIAETISCDEGGTLEARIAHVLGRKVTMVPSPEFEQALKNDDRSLALRAQILAKMPMQTSAAPGQISRGAGKTFRDLPTSGYQREDEAQLFRQMNFLKYRALLVREQIAHSTSENVVQNQALLLGQQLAEFERLMHEAEEIRNHLCCTNLRLVIWVFGQFILSDHVELPLFKKLDSLTKQLLLGLRSQRTEIRKNQEEYESQCYELLLKLIEKFDFGRRTKFSSYAVRSLIRKICYRCLRERRWQTRFETGLLADILDCAERQAVVHETDEDTVLDVGVDLYPFESDREEQESLPDEQEEELGLAEHSSSSGFEKDAYELIIDGKANELLLAENKEENERIIQLITCLLNARERVVLVYRNGLGGQDELTDCQVGEFLDISAQRVCQIEQKFMRRLRDGFAEPEVADYLLLFRPVSNIPTIDIGHETALDLAVVRAEREAEEATAAAKEKQRKFVKQKLEENPLLLLSLDEVTRIILQGRLQLLGSPLKTFKQLGEELNMTAANAVRKAATAIRKLA